MREAAPSGAAISHRLRGRGRTARVARALLPSLAWIVALIVIGVPSWALPISIALIGASIALVVMLGRRGVGFAVVTLIAAAVAAAIAVQAPGRADFARDAADAGGFVGSVTTKIEPAWPGAWRFEADVAGIERPVRGTVSVLFTTDRPADLDLGAVIEIRGAVSPVDAVGRATVDVRMARAPVVLSSPAGVLRLAADARRGLVETSARFPGGGAALLPGLAVGDTSGVDAALDAAMKATGLSHLTAVSGSNCIIVVAAAFACAAAIGLSRGWRAVVALCALAAFVVLVTPEPSVVRAAGMSVVGLVALVSGRRSHGLAVLGTAVAIVLVIDPWLSISIGFALSVAATAALIVLARPLARTLTRVMPAPVAVILSVPFAAQLACAPILIVISPAISVYGVLANVVAAPAAPVATIVGMLATLTTGIPFVGVALTAIAWVPAQWVAATAEFFASLPAVQVPWWEGFAGALALALVCASIAVLLARVRGRLPRTVAVAVLALAAGTGAGLMLVRDVIVPASTPHAWSAAACDVGQGDAMLLRASGQTMLIDTGPDPAALDACLRRLGVAHIDVLVLTHFDADHAGGTDAVNGRVGTVIHGPWEEEKHGRLLHDLATAGAILHPARIGDTIALGEAQARVLWPPNRAIPGNDASVIIEWVAPSMRLLALGDLSADAQRALLSARTLTPPYAVVKVAHHGSADQAEALYAALGAQLGILSVGAENDYGHPRAETLALLARHSIAAVRTDESGLVLVIGGDRLQLWTERRAVRSRRRDARSGLAATLPRQARLRAPPPRSARRRTMCTAE